MRKWIFLGLALVMAAIVIVLAFPKSRVERLLARGERVNIMLSNSQPEGANLMLASYVPETQLAALIFVPGNTLVRDSRGRLGKIIHTDHREALEGLCRLRIPFYFGVDSGGFSGIIDMLGGVKLEVAKPIADEHAGVDIPAGWQILDGRMALDYCRFEELEFGEFGRLARWQNFARAFISRCQGISINRELAQAFLRDAHTNLKVGDVLAVLGELKKMNPEDVRVKKIPGREIYRDWISYWQPEAEATFELVNSLARKETPARVIRVEVLNGCGVSGMASRLGMLLRGQGLDVLNVGNAKNFDYHKTLVLARTGKPELAYWVARLVGTENVLLDPEADRLVDVTIILGKDYCEAQ